MSAPNANRTPAVPVVVITEFYDPTWDVPASTNRSQDTGLLSPGVPERTVHRRQQAGDEVIQQEDHDVIKQGDDEVTRLIGRPNPTVVEVEQTQPVSELEEEFLDFFQAPSPTAPPSALTKMFLRQFRTNSAEESSEDDGEDDSDQALEENVDQVVEDDATESASGPSVLPVSVSPIIDLTNSAPEEGLNEPAPAPLAAVLSVNRSIIDLTESDQSPPSPQRTATNNEPDSPRRSASPPRQAPVATNKLKRKSVEEEDESRDSQTDEDTDEENATEKDEESDEETDEDTNEDNDEDSDDAEDDDEFEQVDDDEDEDYEIQKRGPKRAKVSSKPKKANNSGQSRRTCAQIAADAGRPNWQMVYKRCRSCKENGLRCDPSHPGSVPVKGR